MYIVDMVYCSRSTWYMLLPGHCLLCISACSAAAAEPRDTLLALVLFPEFSRLRHTAIPVVGWRKQMNTVCLESPLVFKAF